MRTYIAFFFIPRIDQESLNDPNRPENVNPTINISLERMKFDVEYAAGPTIDELMGVFDKIQLMADPKLKNNIPPIRIHSIQPDSPIESQK